MQVYSKIYVCWFGIFLTVGFGCYLGLVHDLPGVGLGPQGWLKVGLALVQDLFMPGLRSFQGSCEIYKFQACIHIYLGQVQFLFGLGFTQDQFQISSKCLRFIQSCFNVFVGWLGVSLGLIQGLCTISCFLGLIYSLRGKKQGKAEKQKSR